MLNSKTQSIQLINKPSCQFQLIKKPQTNKGLMGLQNIGNTCFMNSILQCLIHTHRFADFFISQYKNEINQKSKGDVAQQLSALIRQSKNNSEKRKSVPTYQLKKAVENKQNRFEGYDQQDAQEFLKAILESLHDNLNRVMVKKKYKELEVDFNNLQKSSDEWRDYYLGFDDSIVTDVFQGQLMSEIECLQCNHRNQNFDHFWDLSLSFTRALKMYTDTCQLERMLEHFVQPEQLEDTFHCSRCKTHRRSQKRLALWKLPPVLVIHLKRFQYTRFRKDKLNKQITFPQQLDLSSMVRESSDISCQDPYYQLYGVVNHSGSLNGGHYTAECINENDSRWYNFNDGTVSETTVDYSSRGSPNPYILFYAKNSLFSYNNSIK